MEEEDFTSKEADNGQSATEAFNMMEMIKDESAQKNVKVYIITTILLGKRRVSNRGDRKHVHFSFYCQSISFLFFCFDILLPHKQRHDTLHDINLKVFRYKSTYLC